MATTVQVWSNVACAAGATRLVDVSDVANVQWTEELGGKRGGFTLTVPSDSVNVASLAIYNVVRIVDDLENGTTPRVWEYFITGIADAARASLVRITGEAVESVLGRFYLKQTIGGVPTFTFAASNLTPRQYVENYLIPCATENGESWLVAGDFESAAQYSLSWTGQTALWLGNELERQTKLDFWLQRNGDTNYRVMLTRRGASATHAWAFVGRNVVALERTIAADERFITRVYPQGTTISGESEPTHAGQHAWAVASVAGDTVVIDNPLGAGYTDPITADDVVNGAHAWVTHAVPVASRVRCNSACYDSLRNRVVWVGPGWTNDVNANVASGGEQQFNLEYFDCDDNARGYGDLSGLNTATYLPYGGVACAVYCAADDLIALAYHDAGAPVTKVEFINASTFASVRTVTMASTNAPQNGLRYLPGINRVAVLYGAGGASFELINPATGAVTTGPIAADNLLEVNGKLVAKTVGGVSVYTAATLAYDGFTGTANVWLYQWATDGTYLYSYDSTQTNHISRYDPVTRAAPTTYAVTYPAPSTYGFSFTPNQYQVTAVYTGLVVDGRYCVLTRPYQNSPAATTQIAAMVEFSAPGTVVAVATLGSVLVGAAGTTPIPWTTTHNAWGILGYNSSLTATVLVRVFKNDATYPVDAALRFPVQDSVAATQAITKPSSCKGPYLAGQFAEFRADAAYTYRRGLESPTGVATYGYVDAVHSAALVAKRNYHNDGLLRTLSATDLWLSHDTTAYVPNAFGYGVRVANQERRWPSADRPAGTALSRTITKDTTEVTTAPPGDVTLQFRGLPAGFVVLPGDFITGLNTGWVTQRAVANGSGIVVLRIAYLTAGTYTDGTTYTLYTPRPTVAGPYAGVLYPFRTSGGIDAARFMGACTVPGLTGATTAWVVAKLAFFQVGAGQDLNNCQLYVAGPGDTGSLIALTPASNIPAAYTLTEFTLAKQVSLIPGRPAPLAWSIGWASSGQGTLYLRSIHVYVAASETDLLAKDYEHGADANQLWLNGATILGQQGAPTVQYSVQSLEDDPTAAPFVLGGTVQLRDGERGIAATPRAVSISRVGVRRGQATRQPVIGLNNLPESIASAVVEG